MADIDLERERKGGMGWLWTVLALVLLGLIVWWVWPADDDVDLADVEPIEQVEPAATPEPMGEGATLSQILADPTAYIGETFPDMEVTAIEVPTDRGFWIGGQGNRLFALIIDVPEEQPKDINPNATLRITDGTLRAPDHLPNIEGRPLDERTRSIAQEQQVFLVVDERNIEVVEGGEPQPGTDPAEGVMDGSRPEQPQPR